MPDEEGVVGTVSMDITPGANLLWKGVGGHFDNYIQIICEFIDNSISNLEESNSAFPMIHISVTENESHVMTTVEDTGSGITKDDLERCLTLGETPTGESLRNEHGFGLKHALAATNPDNDRWGIYTKCDTDISASQYRRYTAPYIFDASQEIIDANVIEWPGHPSYSNQSGTLVKFPCTPEIWQTISSRPTAFNTLVERLSERLGYIYSTIIASSRVYMKISSFPKRGNPVEMKSITAIVPTWLETYEPGEGRITVDIGGGDIDLKYHFGRIQQTENHSECYRTVQGQSGVEIRLNGRLIVDNLFKEIWNKEPNPQYNHLRIIIDILSNDRDRVPPTLTHKDGFKKTKKYSDLKKTIAGLHPEPVGTWQPSVQTENSLRDRVLENKRRQLEEYIANITSELRVFNGLDADVKLDMYIAKNDGDVEIYECKKDATKLLDLYQLRMYWDGCVYDGIKPTLGILLASRHTSAVIDGIEYLNSMKDANGENYKFKLRTWNDEGISYPQNPNIV